MQRERELSSPLNDSILFQSKLPEPAIGAYCDTTHRIVIISPLPYSLHELVRELTIQCYDVLVFRHWDEEALSVLPIDLMIVDLSKETKLGAAAPQPLRNQGVPMLRLVNTEILSSEEVNKSSSEGLVNLSLESSTIEQVLNRVHSMLAQGSRQSGQRTDQAQLKDLTVDYNRVAVYVGTARIDVTKTEFDLLKALLDAGGKVLSRQELMDRVWGEQYFGGSNTVDVHVKSLRHKLKDDPKAPKYIATIRGVGYRIAD
ncbi:transcriptional regulator [Paenibacillus sp. LMG 31456]|uniref:Transcriptional regulator n=1 Tax=Paenibacillus foliorum TaxID=2654974 RepID=A0A972GZ78_9BACL|nr:winged helix-turn-helix domain-containing protein [Paenibacillus foliorum]NOU97259.1 transcriptional regulator [Paenibacillus foliorum]